MDEETYLDEFESLWHYITNRFDAKGNDVILVQNHDELLHIYNLMKGCNSYIEVGSAEGNSLHVLAHALKGPRASVTYVDYGERKTEKPRQDVIDILKSRNIHVRGVHGVSYNHHTIRDACILSPFDAVLIDAGHDYSSVVADAIAYGGLARKYIFFHDIYMKEVRDAFEWYVQAQEYKNASVFLMPGSTFGYGIIKL